MAVSFPSNPTIGEIFTYQGSSWEWNGTFWQTYTFPSSGLTGSTSVGVGDSLISGIVDNVLELKSLSGDGITITDDGDTILLVSDSSGDYLPLSGGTVTGVTTFDEIVYVNNDFYVDSVYATNYYGLPSFPNTYVTGFSLSNDVITLTQNSNDVYSSFTISLSAYTGNTSGEYLPISGGTVTGGTNFTSGLTANTISATTYDNLPVSGITEGTNIGVTGANGNFTISFTGTVGSDFTGGTVTGATNFTDGLTANTISATTYDNLPVSGITEGTNIGVNNTNGNVTISFTGTTGSNFTGGTVSGATNFTAGLTANTISATTYQNLPVSGITNGTGITSTTSNGVVTITNTSPNQIVTISGGTGITTGGTYPNFTITNSAPNQVVTISGGTGITTGGTYPNFTITNSAPDQTVVINNGYLTESSGTYPTFEVNYTGPTLLASGSVYIIPDGSYYGGSANDGWAGHYWDDYRSTLTFDRAWYGIPIPIEFRYEHYIKVCGVAYTDSSVPEGETLTIDIRYYDCTDFRTTRLGVDGFSFIKDDGICCFTLLVQNTSVTLPENTSFIYLAFNSSNNAMDATITKITYNLSICAVSF